MINPEILERYAQAQDIAGRAGALALVYWRSRDSLAIESKVSAQDIVSEADRAIERQIRAEIATNFPDDGCLGEEYGRTDGTSGFTWVIDPIDGTSPYLHGMPNWCVAIAVLRGVEPVVGEIAGASVANDIITLPKGRYLARCRRKATGAIAVAVGFRAVSGAGFGYGIPLTLAASADGIAEADVPVTVSGESETFELVSIFSGTVGALTTGVAAAITGVDEIYADVTIERLG